MWTLTLNSFSSVNSLNIGYCTYLKRFRKYKNFNKNHQARHERFSHKKKVFSRALSKCNTTITESTIQSVTHMILSHKNTKIAIFLQNFFTPLKKYFRAKVVTKKNCCADNIECKIFSVDLIKKKLNFLISFDEFRVSNEALTKNKILHKIQRFVKSNF